MNTVQPSRCPLCGTHNACAMLTGESACWCQQVQIAPQVLEQIPEPQRGLQCLCRACASQVPPCDSTAS